MPIRVYSTKTAKLVGVATLALVITACSSTKALDMMPVSQGIIAPSSPYLATPPITAVAVPPTTLQAIDGYVLTRGYLTSEQSFVPEGDLPQGILLLVEEQAEKNRTICEGFVKNLPDSYQVSVDSPKAKTITTFWPLTQLSSALTNCDFLLANYDYARAKKVSLDWNTAPLTNPSIVLAQSNGQHVSVLFGEASGERIAGALNSWFGGAVSANAPLLASPTATTEPLFSFVTPAQVATTRPASGTERSTMVTTTVATPVTTPVTEQKPLTLEQQGRVIAESAGCALASRADRADERTDEAGEAVQANWFRVGLGFFGDAAKVLIGCPAAG